MSGARFGSWPSFNGKKVVLDDDPRLAGINSVLVTVDFGHPTDAFQDTTARTTVTGLAWVTATGPITCTPCGWDTTDHGGDDATVEGVRANVVSRVPGVGFDVLGYAPSGTWGRHVFIVYG